MKGKVKQRESDFVKSLGSLSRMVTNLLEKKPGWRKLTLDESVVNQLSSLEVKISQLVLLIQIEAAKKKEALVEPLADEAFTGKDTVDHPRAAELEKASTQLRESISLPLKKRKVKVHVNPRECPICHRVLSTKAARDNHIVVVHTSERPYKCSICGRGFSANYLLQYHIRKKHGPPTHGCQYCGKLFAEHFLKVHHEATHAGEKSFVCPTCGKSFLREFNLKLHLQVHDEKRQYFACEECGKSFSRELGLKLHMRRHTGVGLHKCEKCDRKFTRSIDLKRHGISHDGKREHLCNLCGKGFKYSAGLQYHIRNIHSDPASSDFSCQKCPLTFTNGLALEKHENKHIKCGFSCSECYELFVNKYKLKSHMNKMHASRDNVCYCGASFESGEKLEAHSKLHLLKAQCDLCNKRFRTEKNLYFHKRKCHPGEFAMLNALGKAVQLPAPDEPDVLLMLKTDFTSPEF